MVAFITSHLSNRLLDPNAKLSQHDDSDFVDTLQEYWRDWGKQDTPLKLNWFLRVSSSVAPDRNCSAAHLSSRTRRPAETGRHTPGAAVQPRAEKGRYHEYVLADWALLREEQQVKRYEHLRDRRALLPEVVLPSRGGDQNRRGDQIRDRAGGGGDDGGGDPVDLAVWGGRATGQGMRMQMVLIKGLRIGGTGTIRMGMEMIRVMGLMAKILTVK
ncbi:MAG: hypothetical protein Q9184_006791 [Pyrenodesmia sp. 2 TL-2023]